MIEISRAARYDAPAGTIFAIITDLASYPAWQPGVESAGLAGEGPRPAGEPHPPGSHGNGPPD
jgi:hypothetical protein